MMAERAESLPAALAYPVEGLGGAEAVFLCGPRAVAEVYLREDRVGRTALPPVDALNSLEIAVEPALELAGVEYAWAAVRKRYRGPGGLRVRSEWRAAATGPALVVRYEFTNGGSAAVSCRVWATVVSNVGYMNRFAAHADDLAERDGARVVLRDGQRPELAIVVGMVPDAAQVELSSPEPGRPAAQRVALMGEVHVAPGATTALEVRVATHDAAGACDAEPPAIEALRGRLRDAALLNTPSVLLNQFAAACLLRPAVNVRALPFGPPHDVDARHNALWPVITAAPDAHGVFAADSVQSLWELGLLGPGLYEAARHTVEVMFRFGPRESVECWTGDGRIWPFSIPVGDTPQVVLGACWHLLWTGDAALAERWWPDIERCLMVLDACDADQDALEDRRNALSADVPAPADYDHELLYVQCYWCEAFRKAADVARWLGRAEAAGLRRKANEISRSIEYRFATNYGLGVWLSAAHEPHPHVGTDQIVAAALGVVSERKARQVLATVQGSPLWTADGPRLSDPRQPDGAGRVSVALRWQFVHALLRVGRVEEGLALAERWAAQECELRYAAPVALPAVTGRGRSGQTASAARALRALVFGLTGLQLTGLGVRLSPRLPRAWDGFALANLSVHGCKLNLAVRRGTPGVRVGGAARPEALVRYAELGPRPLDVEITLA